MCVCVCVDDVRTMLAMQVRGNSNTSKRRTVSELSNRFKKVKSEDEVESLKFLHTELDCQSFTNYLMMSSVATLWRWTNLLGVDYRQYSLSSHRDQQTFVQAIMYYLNSYTLQYVTPRLWTPGYIMHIECVCVCVKEIER